eukprot:9081689-Pyramimonas_sp.AAC.1
MREAHAKDPAAPLPEVHMGPACCQIFMVEADQIVTEGDRVGAKNRAAWENCKKKLDNISTQHDLSLL